MKKFHTSFTFTSGANVAFNAEDRKAFDRKVENLMQHIEGAINEALKEFDSTNCNELVETYDIEFETEK